MSAARMDVDSSAPKLTADFLKRKETEDQSTRMPDSTQDAADSDCASGPSELETHVTSRTSKSKKSHQRGKRIQHGVERGYNMIHGYTWFLHGFYMVSTWLYMVIHGYTWLYLTYYSNPSHRSVWEGEFGLGQPRGDLRAGAAPDLNADVEKLDELLVI